MALLPFDQGYKSLFDKPLTSFFALLFSKAESALFSLYIDSNNNIQNMDEIYTLQAKKINELKRYDFAFEISLSKTVKWGDYD